MGRGNAAAAGDLRLGEVGFLKRFAEGLGEEVEQRDELRFLFHGGVDWNAFSDEGPPKRLAGGFRRRGEGRGQFLLGDGGLAPSFAKCGS